MVRTDAQTGHTGRHDIAAIGGALSLIFEPGQVTELRALEASTSTYRNPHTESGYFDDMVKLARAAASIQAMGIYIIPNPLNHALLGRAVNKTRPAPKGESTTDANIIRRRWLLIDADPIRPTGIASTDSEHKAALAVAAAVAENLARDGFPPPIVADSGNGGHLMYRIDLPADDDGLVQNCLESLATKYDSAMVKIDKTVFNPARIWKLYGTIAAKGDADAAAIGRPHRMARIISAPSKLEVVPPRLLESLAAKMAPYGAMNGATRQRTGSNGEHRSRLLVEQWLHDRGVEYRKKAGIDQKGRTIYILATCPFNADHGPDSCIMQAANGEMSAQCFHNGCSSYRWQEFKERIGKPNSHHYDPPLLGQKSQWPRYGCSVTDPLGDEIADETLDREKSGYQCRWIDSATFAKADYRSEWLVKGVCVRNHPGVFGGPSKTLKTTTAADFAISLGTGTKFMGHFEVPRPMRVFIISGESGEFTLQETALRICQAKEIRLDDTLCIWSFELPQLANPSHIALLQRELKAVKADVLLLDPLYLSLLSGGGADSASNLYSMGPLLFGIAKACLSIGVTPFFIHHTKQASLSEYKPIGLEHLAYAGIQEFSRQWFLVNRREKYEPGSGIHKIWLQAGGSIGQGGCWCVDIDEGRLGADFSGRKWEVTVMSDVESREAKSQQKEQAKTQKERDDDEKILNALDRMDPQKRGISFTRLRDGSGVNKRAAVAIERLIARGVLEDIPDFKTPTGRPARGIKKRTSGTSG